MAQLTFHFEADPTTDLHAAAVALGDQAKTLEEVTAVDARPEEVQAVGVAEILLALTLSASVLEDLAKAVDGLTHLVESIKRLVTTLGLRKGRVEIGLRQVPIDELTPDDLREYTED